MQVDCFASPLTAVQLVVGRQQSTVYNAPVFTRSPLDQRRRRLSTPMIVEPIVRWRQSGTGMTCPEAFGQLHRHWCIGLTRLLGRHKQSSAPSPPEFFGVE